MRTQRFRLISLILLAALFLVACSGPAAEPTPTPVAPPTTLKISGSGAVTRILEALKPAFEANVPAYRLEILPGSDTGGGVEGAIQGVLDVAAMSRPPKEEELTQIKYLPLGLGSETPIAHADVGVTSLTREEVIAIFSGEITDWSQVGGPNLPIIVYVRSTDSGHTQAIRAGIFGDTPYVETAQVMGSLSDMLIAVEATPGGVGHACWPGAAAGGSNVQAIALDGAGPEDPTFPAQLQLGIGYLPERQADVQPLVDWLLSEPGQAALREFGVITTR